MTLQERMQAVIDYSGLSIPQLAKNVGFKPLPNLKHNQLYNQSYNQR